MALVGSFGCGGGLSGVSGREVVSGRCFGGVGMLRMVCGRQRLKLGTEKVCGVRALEMDRFLAIEDVDELSEGFFEAIEELERMTRETSDVLEGMNERLSDRELQLVLVYFSREGRDSWCALEVFDWLRKENRVDDETMELMVSIMCRWVKNLIEGEHVVGDVVDLLVDMDCVGLKPDFSLIEKAIGLYWDIGEKEKAVLFVEEVLRRDIDYSGNDKEGKKGGPAGYLAWKMMVCMFTNSRIKMIEFEC